MTGWKIMRIFGWNSCSIVCNAVACLAREEKHASETTATFRSSIAVREKFPLRELILIKTS